MHFLSGEDRSGVHHAKAGRGIERTSGVGRPGDEMQAHHGFLYNAWAWWHRICRIPIPVTSHDHLRQRCSSSNCWFKLLAPGGMYQQPSNLVFWNDFSIAMSQNSDWNQPLYVCWALPLQVLLSNAPAVDGAGNEVPHFRFIWSLDPAIPETKDPVEEAMDINKSHVICIYK